MGAEFNSLKWPTCGCSKVCTASKCRRIANSMGGSRETGRGIQAGEGGIITGAQKDIIKRKKYGIEDFKRVIAAARQWPVVATICATCGIHEQNLKYWLKFSREGRPGDMWDIPVYDGINDEPHMERFHILFAEALDDGDGHIEHEAMLLARGMAQEVLEHQGKLTQKIDRELVALGYPENECLVFDDQGFPVYESKPVRDPEMIRWLLARRKPDRYGNKQTFQHEHKVGGVLVVGNPMSREAYEKKFMGPQPIIDVEFEGLPELPAPKDKEPSK